MTFLTRERLAAFQYWPQVVTLLIIALAFGAYRYFAYYDTRSNDAFVSANFINMAALVSGPVTHLYIEENQRVKRGDKLIEIDPRPYRYALNKARAAVKIAQINYDNDKYNIVIAQQRLEQSKAELALSLDHLKRYSDLTRKGALAEIKLIDVESRIKEQEALVMAASQNLDIARMNLDDSKVLSAMAERDRAQYLYDNTTVYAPSDGFITNFNLRHGQYIAVGEGLFALVERDHWWVNTRYRETMIRLVKPGDKAEIMLDMYPGKVFHGHVESIGWGINRVQSGSVAPSTLVYMEATEDWIKIAQRFPVRIAFDEADPAYPLRIGASATTITYR